MRIAEIKLLVVIDSSIVNLSYIEEALRLQNEDYKKGTDGEVTIKHKIIRKDLSNIPWVAYYGDNWGVSQAWIHDDTKTLPTGYSVAYVIAYSHWTKNGNQSIYGWHVGRFNDLQVQLIRELPTSTEAMYRSFLMELFHSWDGTYKRHTGRAIEELFEDITYFDREIVHAEHPSYTVFQYVPVIRKLKDFFISYFSLKKSDNMRYIIDSRGDQYLLNDELKFAVGIGDGEELKKLQDRGLSGSPVSQEVPPNYLKYAGVEVSRLETLIAKLKDLLNL